MTCGSFTDAPPESARSQLPARSAAQAASAVESEVEHAVWRLMLGPVSPSLYDVWVAT
jgi:hypothetical protein